MRSYTYAVVVTGDGEGFAQQLGRLSDDGFEVVTSTCQTVLYDLRFEVLPMRRGGYFIQQPENAAPHRYVYYALLRRGYSR